MYRHFSEWQADLKPIAWTMAAAAHQQGWGKLEPINKANFVTREQFLAAIEQAKNHAVGQQAKPAEELVSAAPQDAAERLSWDKERRLAAIRHTFNAPFNKGGDKGKALDALVTLWEETRDASILSFRIPCHPRLQCKGPQPYGCDGCWAMGRIFDLLAEHYEQMGLDKEALRKRVHQELGQGSHLAWLVLRQIRSRKNKRLNPSWDWERAYKNDLGALQTALGRAVQERDDPCTDNYRVARLDRRKDMKRYRAQKERGCCGSHDEVVTIGGFFGLFSRRYTIGFNFGH
jgi:hypothetical protein